LALANNYVLPYKRIPEVFGKIRDGQAPERFTIQLLKDWGFTSTNDRAFIALMKALGFLSADGKPTQRYNEYRDHSRSKAIMGEALREAYSDIFLIKANPSTADTKAIEGKFKSFHNVSDHVAGLMTKTFYGLLGIADLAGSTKPKVVPPTDDKKSKDGVRPTEPDTSHRGVVSGLHYNIQIHLPATKDVEVYNAIFKSLREHLFDE
jgi:hypothetical protein